MLGSDNQLFRPPRLEGCQRLRSAINHRQSKLRSLCRAREKTAIDHVAIELKQARKVARIVWKYPTHFEPHSPKRVDRFDESGHTLVDGSNGRLSLKGAKTLEFR